MREWTASRQGYKAILFEVEQDTSPQWVADGIHEEIDPSSFEETGQPIKVCE